MYSDRYIDRERERDIDIHICALSDSRSQTDRCRDLTSIITKRSSRTTNRRLQDASIPLSALFRSPLGLLIGVAQLPMQSLHCLSAAWQRPTQRGSYVNVRAQQAAHATDSGLLRRGAYSARIVLPTVRSKSMAWNARAPSRLKGFGPLRLNPKP